MLKAKIKKYFFYLKFNMLFLFLVVQETVYCVMLVGYDFGKIERLQGFRKVGGDSKLGGLQPCCILCM